MKKLFLICIALMFVVSCATVSKTEKKVEKEVVVSNIKPETKEIAWRVDEIAGEAEAEYNDKIMIIYFYPNSTLDCKPCDDMETNTLDDERVIECINDKFVAVRLETTKDVMKEYHVTSVPSFQFFYDGRKLGAVHGYASPEKFLKVLDKAIELKEGK